MQTGNIIYSTIYFINGNIQYAAYCITLIFSFFTCLVISNLLKRKIDNVHKFRKISFLIAAVILLICIFIPIDFQYSNVLPFQVKKTFLNLIGNILLSEGSWEYLFGIDYWVDAQEYYKNGKLKEEGGLESEKNKEELFWNK